jgi:hypothetical protein
MMSNAASILLAHRFKHPGVPGSFGGSNQCNALIAETHAQLSGARTRARSGGSPRNFQNFFDGSAVEAVGDTITVMASTKRRVDAQASISRRSVPRYAS